MFQWRAIILDVGKLYYPRLKAWGMHMKYLDIYIHMCFTDILSLSLQSFNEFFFFCRHELIYTKYDIIAGPSDVSHIVQGLEPGVEYLFVVTATNQAGEGETSNSRSTKTFNAGLSNQSIFSHLKVVTATCRVIFNTVCIILIYTVDINGH